jgi:phage terminase Nu1 subunit (DNA packaging protein)
MGKSQTTTIAERLEVQRLASLVQSAREKQAAGRTLTKGEIAAVAELERRNAGQTASASSVEPPLDVAAVVRAMLLLGSEHEPLIREALGDATVKSIPTLAKIFGVTDPTVRNSWRRNGMPGVTTRARGQAITFRLADVVMWRIQCDENARAGRRRSRGGQDDPNREELAAIELESARLGLDLLRGKAAAAQGDTVSRQVVQAEAGAILTTLRDGLLEIPHHIKPVLPAKIADRVCAEVDRIVRHLLTAMADGLSQLVERAREGERNGDGQDE